MFYQLTTFEPGGGAALRLYSPQGNKSVVLDVDERGVVEVPAEWAEHPTVARMLKTGRLVPFAVPEAPEETDELLALPGVSDEIAGALRGAGWATLDDVAQAIEADHQGLLDVPGIGPATLAKITEFLEERAA